MNDDQRPERDSVPTATQRSCTDGQLERYKRASLGNQAQRAAWQLGALVRRVEHEAPHVQRPLRDAVEALLQLSQQLARQHAGETLPPGSPRQGELF